MTVRGRTGDRMVEGREAVRIDAASPAWRRFYAVYIPLFAAVLVWTILWGEASLLTIMLFAAVLIAQVPMAFLKSGYVEFSVEGLRINSVVRSRTIPWSDVKSIELATAGCPAQIVLADGDTVRSEASARFVAPPHGDAEVITALEREAAVHGFVLER